MGYGYREGWVFKRSNKNTKWLDFWYYTYKRWNIFKIMENFFSYKNGKKTILIQSYDIWFSKAAFSNMV